MPRMTQAQADAHQAKLRASANKYLAGLQTGPVEAAQNSETDTPTKLRRELEILSRHTTDEGKLNKTEKARLAHLRLLKMPCLNVQAITLKLADDCRFTADFTYVDENGRLTFEDVKGFQREDALLKIKFAARKFTEFRFVIVKKNYGSWAVEEVKP